MLAEHPHPPFYLFWVCILGDPWEGSSTLSEVTPGSLYSHQTVVGSAGGPTSYSRPVENGARLQPRWLRSPETKRSPCSLPVWVLNSNLDGDAGTWAPGLMLCYLPEVAFKEKYGRARRCRCRIARDRSDPWVQTGGACFQAAPLPWGCRTHHCLAPHRESSVTDVRHC